jgi:hypothetical protein
MERGHEECKDIKEDTSHKSVGKCNSMVGLSYVYVCGACEVAFTATWLNGLLAHALPRKEILPQLECEGVRRPLPTPSRESSMEFDSERGKESPPMAGASQDAGLKLLPSTLYHPAELLCHQPLHILRGLEFVPPQDQLYCQAQELICV